jgi:hypothetical protein
MPMQMRPLEPLREFLRALDATKDLNTLLSSFASALQASAEF